MVKQDQKAKKRISALYGVNKELRTLVDVDRSLAAECDNGTFVGCRRDGVLIYRGIPYAKPPVGKLRWKRPEAPDHDDGVYEAIYNACSPIQTEWPTEVASYYPQSEDCLYLNIWTADRNPSKESAVMVFFHGGAYGWGGTIDPLYDGFNFVDRHRDIVLVTVGYRTGLFGFVDLSMLPGGEEFPDAPNVGLMDQIESLRWVKKNIEAFGGDPDNVTIFGESAGGGTVSLLPIIDEAKGLFKRVIAQSGSAALTNSKEDCKPFTDRLVKESGISNATELAALPIEILIKVNQKINEFNNFPQRDGKFIPLDPYAAYASGLTKDYDMIQGTNANEMNYWIGELGGFIPFRFGIPVKYENDLRKFNPKDRRRATVFIKRQKGYTLWKMVEFYNEMMFRLPAVKQMELHEKCGGRGYMYYWTVPSSIIFRKACHAVELAYVFGNTDETIYTGAPADKHISEMVGDMWAQFARTGCPDIDGVSWPLYDSKRRTLVIDRKMESRKVLDDQRKILYPLLKYMVNAAYVDIDLNVPFTHKAIRRIIALVSIAALGIWLSGGDD